MAPPKSSVFLNDMVACLWSYKLLSLMSVGLVIGGACLGCWVAVYMCVVKGLWWSSFVGSDQADSGIKLYGYLIHNTDILKHWTRCSGNSQAMLICSGCP